MKTYSDEFKQICEMFLTGDRSNVELAYSLLSTLSIQERSVFIKSVIKEVGKMYVAKELLHKITYPETPSSKYLIDKTMKQYPFFHNFFRHQASEYISPLICGIEKVLKHIRFEDCRDIYDFSNFKKLNDVLLEGYFNKSIYSIPNLESLYLDSGIINSYDESFIKLKYCHIYKGVSGNVPLINRWNNLANIDCDYLQIEVNLFSDKSFRVYPTEKIHINCNVLVLRGINNMTIDLGMFCNSKHNTKIICMSLDRFHTFSLKGIDDFIDNGGTLQFTDDALFIHELVGDKWVNTNKKYEF